MMLYVQEVYHTPTKLLIGGRGKHTLHYNEMLTSLKQHKIQLSIWCSIHKYYKLQPWSRQNDATKSFEGRFFSSRGNVDRPK